MRASLLVDSNFLLSASTARARCSPNALAVSMVLLLNIIFFNHFHFHLLLDPQPVIESMKSFKSQSERGRASLLVGSTLRLTAATARDRCSLKALAMTISVVAT